MAQLLLEAVLQSSNGTLPTKMDFRSWRSTRRPGAPLDNNLAEQALKMTIRHRKNSLFYKTERGAHVGDLYMSLIHTCYLSNVDPFTYLAELQRNHARVARAPADWLPWNYQRQLAGPSPALS